MGNHHGQQVEEQQFFAYCFEAKGIQRYILDGGRLRDMVAASALIDALAGPVLSKVEAALAFALPPDYVRRAAGAVTAIFKSTRDRADFLRLWSLTVQRVAPGLEFTQGSGDGDTALAAVKQAQANLIAARNEQPALMPVAGPYITRAPRTGGAAVLRERDEEIDAATLRKRALPVEIKESALTARLELNYVDDEGKPVDIVWPTNLNREDKKEVFPYRGDNQYLAIVHADGNGLGQLLMNLAAAAETDSAIYIWLFSEFSKRLERATCTAASKACQETFVPEDGVMPARPFVLGGDDLGFIVRGDRALDFTASFLRHFETETATFLTDLVIESQKKSVTLTLPNKLTACAGIAFVKAHQPFYLAYDLAESLCAFAKRDAKKRLAGDIAPACLAFHRITTSMIDDYRKIRERELSVTANGASGALTRQPYYVDAVPKTGAALEDLTRLAALLVQGALGASALHDMLGRVSVSYAEAGEVYRRWRQVTKQRDVEHKTDVLGEFDARMQKLLAGTPVAQDFGANIESTWQTPLYDAFSWNAILGEADNDRD